MQAKWGADLVVLTCVYYITGKTSKFVNGLKINNMLQLCCFSEIIIIHTNTYNYTILVQGDITLRYSFENAYIAWVAPMIMTSFILVGVTVSHSTAKVFLELFKNVYFTGYG